MDLTYWINTVDYTPTQLIWNGIGCAFWVVTYVVMVKEIIQKKFVEMPFFIAAGNIAWEFVWSVFYHPNTGMLYSLSYQGAFLLDCFIFYHLLKEGAQQVNLQELKHHFKAICFGSLLMWLPLNYFFVKNGFDTSIGSNSGYILNLFISVLYPLLLLRTSAEHFSKTIAWCKMLGTGFITVSMFLIYPENYFVQTLGICCLILDCGYIALLNKKKNEFIPVTP